MGTLRLIFVLLIVVVLNSAQKFNSLKINHSPGDFTDRELEYLVQLQDDNQFKKDLDKILIPRVVGSIGHTDVYNYIKNTLNDLGYEVETDEFIDITPVGNLTFRNIIASLNPNAERFFVVAAHYDSKYFENGNFLGATDSAVPCAMMLQIARVFKQFDFPKKDEVSLKFIFFDGEEAFVQWGPRDSIYGARHLANKMHKDQSRSKLTGEIVTDLQRVDCLMLLDLLGHANPKIFNYFANTREWFNLLSNVEKRLYRLGLLKKSFSSPYFNKNLRNAFIEDDHIPFIKKGVPVLHLIPIPFPDVWHTLNDNADILDPNTIYDINLTIQVFLAHYLHV